MSKDTEKVQDAEKDAAKGTAKGAGKGASKDAAKGASKDAAKPQSPIRSWITIGTLAATAVGVANKARKARQTTDHIAQAEVVVGAASLAVTIAKTLRDLRKPKPDPETP